MEQNFLNTYAAARCASNSAESELINLPGTSDETEVAILACVKPSKPTVMLSWGTSTGFTLGY